MHCITSTSTDLAVFLDYPGCPSSSSSPMIMCFVVQYGQRVQDMRDNISHLHHTESPKFTAVSNHTNVDKLPTSKSSTPAHLR